MKRVLTALSIAGLAALLVAGPAGAQTDPYSGSVTQTGDTRSSVEFEVDCAPFAGADVTISLGGAVVGTEACASGDVLLVDVSGLDCGTAYTVTAAAGSQVIDLGAVSTDPCIATLAFTGASDSLGRNAAIGGSLLALGAGLVLFGRRRRATEVTA